MLNYQLSPRGAETGLFVLMDVGHIFAVRDFDWLVGGARTIWRYRTFTLEILS